jgi:hypothetical protein
MCSDPRISRQKQRYENITTKKQATPFSGDGEERVTTPDLGADEAPVEKYKESNNAATGMNCFPIITSHSASLLSAPVLHFPFF